MCDEPAVKRTVKKDGKNKGKLFYGCPFLRCSFFEWADAVPLRLTHAVRPVHVGNTGPPPIEASATLPLDSNPWAKRAAAKGTTRIEFVVPANGK